MLGNSGIGLGVQLGPQGGVLVRRNSAATARRRGGSELIGRIASAREQPFHRRGTDRKDRGDLSAWDPALDRCDNPLS